MDTGARILVAICALGGGGGIPWLLHKTNLLSSSTSSSSSSAEVSAPSPSSELSTSPKELEQPPKNQEESVAQLPVPQPPVPLAKTNAENCLVKDKLDELESLIWDSGIFINVDTFVRVSCSKTDSDHNSQMSNEWSGLFPNTLFKNRGEVTEGKRIEIKTETKTLEDSTKYQTIFKGSHFYEKIEGEWNKSNPDETEEKVTEVKITHSNPSAEKIYLLFKK